MSPLVQTLLAILVVAACAAAVGWRAYRVLSGRKTGCGCDHCPALKKPSRPGPDQTERRA
jgi:hypothetical protein